MVKQAQPSLKCHGDENRWAEWAERELEGNGMFGKVQRHGKVRLPMCAPLYALMRIITRTRPAAPSSRITFIIPTSTRTACARPSLAGS